MGFLADAGAHAAGEQDCLHQTLARQGWGKSGSQLIWNRLAQIWVVIGIYGIAGTPGV
jgi:hypothetical protein